MLNVRLDKKTDEALKRYTEEHEVSKSMVVKEALASYLSQKERSERPFILGEDLFGVDGSGRSDLSSSYKSKLKQKLVAKHSD